MAYQPIEDYGIIGDMNTVALISQQGSIDWFCFPYLDSPSVFAALLDENKGGRLTIHPAEEFDSTSEYIPQTNILVTRFRTRRGVLKVTDVMFRPLCRPCRRPSTSGASGSTRMEQEVPGLWLLPGHG